MSFRTNAEAYAAWKTTSMANYDPAPVTFARGEGARLWDVEGKAYVDLAGGVAVSSLGHGHPDLARAIADQASKLIHTSNLYVVENQVLLGQRLLKLSGLHRAFFCNSGTEAIEAALKLARYWGTKNGQRHGIISTHKSFHGRTMGAVSATGQPHYHEGFEPLLPGISFVPYGDAAALRKAVGPETCAIILEPIQGEGGVHAPPASYLREVRQLCDERNLLLILDEVQTGIARTGRWFAYESAGIQPDILALAKGLGGGVPIGAMLCSARADAFKPGAHGSTFGGGPLATRAGLTVLDVIERDGILNNVKARSEQIQKRLLAWSKKGFIQNPRGEGLLLGFDLPGGGARALVKRLVAAGVLVTACGDSTIRLCPPLTITAAEVDAALDVVALQVEAPRVAA